MINNNIEENGGSSKRNCSELVGTCVVNHLPNKRFQQETNDCRADEGTLPIFNGVKGSSCGFSPSAKSLFDVVVGRTRQGVDENAHPNETNKSGMSSFASQNRKSFYVPLPQVQSSPAKISPTKIITHQEPQEQDTGGVPVSFYPVEVHDVSRSNLLPINSGLDENLIEDSYIEDLSQLFQLDVPHSSEQRHRHSSQDQPVSNTKSIIDDRFSPEEQYELHHMFTNSEFAQEDLRSRKVAAAAAAAAPSSSTTSYSQRVTIAGHTIPLPSTFSFLSSSSAFVQNQTVPPVGTVTGGSSCPTTDISSQQTFYDPPEETTNIGEESSRSDSQSYSHSFHTIQRLESVDTMDTNHTVQSGTTLASYFSSTLAAPPTFPATSLTQRSLIPTIVSQERTLMSFSAPTVLSSSSTVGTKGCTNTITTTTTGSSGKAKKEKPLEEPLFKEMLRLLHTDSIVVHISGEEWILTLQQTQFFRDNELMVWKKWANLLSGKYSFADYSIPIVNIISGQPLPSTALSRATSVTSTTGPYINTVQMFSNSSSMSNSCPPTGTASNTTALTPMEANTTSMRPNILLSKSFRELEWMMKHFFSDELKIFDMITISYDAKNLGICNRGPMLRVIFFTIWLAFAFASPVFVYLKYDMTRFLAYYGEKEYVKKLTYSNQQRMLFFCNLIRIAVHKFPDKNNETFILRCLLCMEQKNSLKIRCNAANKDGFGNLSNCVIKLLKEEIEQFKLQQQLPLQQPQQVV